MPKVGPGRATGPPDPRSVSFWSSVAALLGAKKSCADMVPSLFTPRRTTASASWPGGWDPGPGAGEMPLPVESRIRPGPSEARPPPPCQMPAMPLAAESSVAHRVVARVVVLTPST